MESCIFTLLFYVCIAHILSLALDLLLHPFSFASALPQSTFNLLALRCDLGPVPCVIPVTAPVFLILVEGMYFMFAFA